MNTVSAITEWGESQGLKLISLFYSKYLFRKGDVMQFLKPNGDVLTYIRNPHGFVYQCHGFSALDDFEKKKGIVNADKQPLR